MRPVRLENPTGDARCGEWAEDCVVARSDVIELPPHLDSVEFDGVDSPENHVIAR